MNRWLVLVAAILSLIGLAINLSMDFDNVYDMTLTGLWAITFIVLILGLILSGGWRASIPSRETVAPRQSSAAQNTNPPKD